MQNAVGWIERPQKKIGLDNLGTQQPCVTIYTRLLPGITNVTDRAAYFGFYPWFVRAFEARNPNATDAEFREKLRVADCLMTLIAERHAISKQEDIARHSATCPGRLTLGPVAHQLSDGRTVNLSNYADRSEDNKSRYFKNPLGGLGQYYLGPLRDQYNILRGDPRAGVGYWLETGAPLADAYGNGLNTDLFFAAVEADSVTASDLDHLATFCPCNLSAAGRDSAQTALISLFLRDNSASGIARRNTFALILEFLLHRGGAPVGDSVKEYLASCYSGMLGGQPWVLNKQLEVVRRGWALYARNEMLSLTWSTLFKNALDALDGHPKTFGNIQGLSRWIVSTPAFALRPAAGFQTLLQNDTIEAPALVDAAHPDHELGYWRELLASNPPPVERAIKLLVRLVSRFQEEEDDSYRGLDLPPGTLSGYPLNLNSLRSLAGKWALLDADAWLEALISEVLVTHQRIAIRKMGQSGEDTLMFRSGDLGYFVHREMERVVETQPRLRQALQILRDLGLTTSEAGHLPQLTPLGLSVLEEMET